MLFMNHLGLLIETNRPCLIQENSASRMVTIVSINKEILKQKQLETFKLRRICHCYKG